MSHLLSFFQPPSLLFLYPFLYRSLVSLAGPRFVEHTHWEKWKKEVLLCRRQQIYNQLSFELHHDAAMSLLPLPHFFLSSWHQTFILQHFFWLTQTFRPEADFAILHTDKKNKSPIKARKPASIVIIENGVDAHDESKKKKKFFIL